MKCPHCGQEHPDDFKFCPITGESVISQTKVCTNRECQYPYIPIDAKFCPRCGSTLVISDDRLKSEPPHSSYDYTLFPISGLTVGKTNLFDILDKSNINEYDNQFLYGTFQGMYNLIQQENIITRLGINIKDSTILPDQWGAILSKTKGLTSKIFKNHIIPILEHHGFSRIIAESCVYTTDNDKLECYGLITPDEKYLIVWDFYSEKFEHLIIYCWECPYCQSKNIVHEINQDIVEFEVSCYCHNCGHNW